MADKVVVRGRVFSGLGQGSFFTQLDWFKQQCLDKLGFIPFPGTLNLKVSGEYLGIVEKLKKEKGISFTPPRGDFCQAKGFSATVRGIEAAIIIPEAEHFTEEVHTADVIEVIAPVNIKKALSVADGDELLVLLEGRRHC